MRGGDDDAFVTKLDGSGVRAYSTYFGAPGTERAYGIIVDASGNAYFTGESTPPRPAANLCVPIPPATGQDAFVAKLNGGGTQLLSLGYIGGTSVDSGLALASAGNNRIYVRGVTYSSNFPTTDNALRRIFQDSGFLSSDGFLALLDLTPPVPASGVLSLVSGTPQTAALNTGFGLPLKVKVIDTAGTPVHGVMVTFTPPGSGASAALSATTATTDCNGEASVTATANGTAGSYVVSAAAGGISGTATFDLTNSGTVPPPPPTGVPVSTTPVLVLTAMVLLGIGVLMRRKTTA